MQIRIIEGEGLDFEEQVNETCAFLEASGYIVHGVNFTSKPSRFVNHSFDYTATILYEMKEAQHE